jgi:hypothetical protein
MAKRLKLKGAGSGITVELDDRAGTKAVYEMVPVTLEVEEELDDCTKEIDRLQEDPETQPLERMEAIVAQLDVLLTREGAGPDDDKPEKPSELLLAAYTAKPGRITGMEIKELVREMVQYSRPT